MAGNTVKLQTNIPLVFSSITGVTFAPTKTPGWQNQIAVDGMMGNVQARVYLPERMANDLAVQGYVEIASENEGGEPIFKLLKRDGMTVLRTEEGTKKFTALNPDRESLPTPKPRGTPSISAPKAPVVAQKAPQGTTKAVENPQDRPGEWAVLEATYAECARIAARTWGDMFDAGMREKVGLSDVGLIAAAATLFIAATKNGLKAMPAPTPPVGLDKMPRALVPNPDAEDDGLGF